jgi:peroxiredoxin
MCQSFFSVMSILCSVGAPALALSAACLVEPSGHAPAAKEPSFAIEARRVQNEMRKRNAARIEEYHREFDAAKTDAEKQRVRERSFRRRVDANLLAEHLVTLVRPHAADPASVEALTFVLNYYRGGHQSARAADEAVDLLIKYHLKDERTIESASIHNFDMARWTERLLRALAAADFPPPRKARILYELAQYVEVEAELPSWLALLVTWDPAVGRWYERVKWEPDYLALMKAEQPKREAEAVKLFERVAAKYGDLLSGSRGHQTYGECARAAVFRIRNLTVGKPAPDFACTDAAGQTIRLSALKGQVVLLDFWATWCGPCRAEFPHMRELKRQYAGRPLTIVGISVDEDRGAWEKFLKKEQLPWAQWYTGPAGVVKDWNVCLYPTRYLIDHKGVIRESPGLCGGFSDEGDDRLLDHLMQEASGDLRQK